MPVEERFREPIQKLVAAILAGDWEWIEKEALDEALTGKDVQQAIKEYGKTIISLPNEAFDVSEQYELDSNNSKLGIELPFWTMEEGRSDLEMRLWGYADNGNGDPKVVLYDVLTP